jgi:DNA repair protein RadC
MNQMNLFTLPAAKAESHPNTLNERVAAYGPEALTDRELVQLIAGEPGSLLLDAAGGLGNLRRWSIAQIAGVKGIGQATAVRIAAALALGVRNSEQPKTPLNTPDRVFDYMKSATATLSVEKFWVLCLNRKNTLIKRIEVTSGTASSCLVHPREVFRHAIVHGAVSIVCVHNHPSGDPSPSSADLQVTRQLREAARTVGVDMLDHVIIGTPHEDPRHAGFYSFQEAGLI